MTTVAIFGATGSQGGSVARALLFLTKENNNKGQYKVIALTRDVKSEKAKKLKDAGAELRSCDLNNPSDVESSLQGVNIVFAVTDFWGAGASVETEIKHGKAIVDAAKKNGVHHLVFSTLENSSKISGGKRQVIHFDSKSSIEEYVVKSRVPYTIVQPACYYENFKQIFLRPNEEGYEFTFPIPGNSKIAFFSVDETGLVVSEVIKQKEKNLNKKIAMTGDYISPDEIATILSEHFGKKVKYNSVSETAYATFPIPGAKEVAEMFCFFDEYGYFGEKAHSRDLWEGKQIAPKLSTFEQYAKNLTM